MFFLLSLFILRLDLFSGHIGVETGVDASVTMIMVVITVTAFISIAASISSPALDIVLSVSVVRL